MRTEEENTDYKDKFDECNNRYKAIFDLTSAASKVINSDLTILKVNHALTQLLGYTATEIEGTKILDYACPEYKQHWHDLQKAMWEDGKPFFKLDACIIKKDQSLAWVNVTTILFHENDESYGFTVLDDYTYRKEFEESQKRLNMALKYSKMAVWEIDLNKGSVIHSDGFNEIFGKETSFKGWDKNMMIEQFLPEDRATLNNILSTVRDDAVLDYQARIRTPDGVIKWVNIQAKAEGELENGKAKKFLGTIYDITKDKLAERHKEDFISIASHELRTPITSLKASLQLMTRMQNERDKIPELIHHANKSMDKVTHLIDDLLNASKINEGQLQLKKTTFKISKAIDECCEYVYLGGVFKLITEGDTSLEVYADSERIQQVIVNFVNNAIKYAPASKDIRIRIEREEPYAKVSVIDQGPGIEEEKLPLLFTRYFKANNNGFQYSGLGLGLYISHEIIKKHEGLIGVKSEPGKGSTFWFKLPLIRTQ